jgi:hypothetical protein
MNTKFLFCVENKGCPDLEMRKVYQAIEDPTAQKHGQVRIIDESGEDYLYPENYFAPVELSKSAEKIFKITA